MRDLQLDIKVISFSLSFHGQNLIEDTTLEMSYGRRYGFIGRNGSGKSTFLEALASGDLKLPEYIDRYLLNKEVAPSDRTSPRRTVSPLHATRYTQLCCCCCCCFGSSSPLRVFIFVGDIPRGVTPSRLRY